MKKFATLAVLAAVAGGAYAQSSVTLFGIVDEAARYTKNGDSSQKALVSGGLNTSRIGLRGFEDLGSGLKAGFWLESGLNANNGTNSDTTRFWNRRSTLSLLGNFGEVRLGRDFTPTYTGYSDYDVFGDNGVAASSKFDISMGVSRDGQVAPGQYTNSGETRADNQIQYFTPGNLGGFYGRGSVASSNGTTGKKYAGGRVGYGAGPLDVSASYGQYTVAPASSGDDKFKTYDLGASYDFGVVKLSGYYTQSKFVSQKIATYSLGAVAPVGLGMIRAAYTHANQSGTAAVTTSTTIAGVTNVDANDATQFALGYIYNLSKRTAVYTTGAYIRNKGNAQFVAGSTVPGIVGGQNSRAVEVGMRHSF